MKQEHKQPIRHSGSRQNTEMQLYRWGFDWLTPKRGRQRDQRSFARGLQGELSVNTQMEN